ncbi:alpha/beta-hydrolase [Canariomyces notabilis]|uniref:Alpha/beta-hydrolase n=1 Tax=Canariomyces notabilis TaxID=2074819 RepID=A0AAN6TNX0_9PEZI|nr:alpha/beta-hydrolase [Canariomyces arenarius]
MEPSPLRSTVLALCLTLGIPAALYIGALSTMVLKPSLQAHAIYLHKVTLTWFKDLDIPEQFGFANHQVTPFYIPTPDGERLHTWHVLPIGAYVTHQDALLAQGPEGGLVDRFQDTLNFRLLSDSPAAKLVVYFHGTSGTMASGWRPASYRSLYAVDPLNTHVLTFDYRGYGKSTGHPSEEGLITDALAVVDWALHVARIPAERIVIYGQSLGSAVAIALVHELVQRELAVEFAGLVVTASFANVAELTATYRIGGLVPVLSPVARVKPLFDFFASRLQSKWDNERRLSEFVQKAGRYDVTLIHSEDDCDIPMAHSIRLFRAAVRAAEADEALLLDDVIEEKRVSHGEGGSRTVWSTKKGDIRLEIPKYGVHDKVMSYPITGLAIGQAFNSTG